MGGTTVWPLSHRKGEGGGPGAQKKILRTE